MVKKDAATAAARIKALKNATHLRVVQGEKGDADTTCIVAVQTSVAAELHLLVWRKPPMARTRTSTTGGTEQSHGSLWPHCV